MLQSKKTKGQAALEFLTTYGWGFIVILVTIGALSYFGFFSPSKYIPEKCYFGSQMICEDYYVGNGEIRLYLRNDYGKDINITKAELTNIDTEGTFNEPVTITSSTTEEIIIKDLILGYPGDKEKYVVELTFEKSEGGPSHKIIGTIDATIAE